MEHKEWFADWFDSKYYHILYKNRNHQEAEQFIFNLIQFVKPNISNKMVDLACGKGRHSVYLNSLGYNVTGIDLSVNSIAFASQFKNNNLHFKVADLRELPFENTFDVGFNLFTSIGYFDSNEANKIVFHQFNKILKPNGIIVIDFFNATKIYSNTNCIDNKEIDNILFTINKKIENNRVLKTIEFTDNDKHFYFTESVQLLTLNNFKTLLHEASFKLINIFGSYKLDAFDEQTSDRLIIIAQKI